MTDQMTKWLTERNLLWRELLKWLWKLLLTQLDQTTDREGRNAFPAITDWPSVWPIVLLLLLCMWLLLVIIVKWMKLCIIVIVDSETWTIWHCVLLHTKDSIIDLGQLTPIVNGNYCDQWQYCLMTASYCIIVWTSIEAIAHYLYYSDIIVRAILTLLILLEIVIWYGIIVLLCSIVIDYDYIVGIVVIGPRGPDDYWWLLHTLLLLKHCYDPVLLLTSGTLLIITCPVLEVFVIHSYNIIVLYTNWRQWTKEMTVMYAFIIEEGPDNGIIIINDIENIIDIIDEMTWWRSPRYGRTSIEIIIIGMTEWLLY